jgi:hypothetical protein
MPEPVTLQRAHTLTTPTAITIQAVALAQIAVVVTGTQPPMFFFLQATTVMPEVPVMELLVAETLLEITPILTTPRE